MKLPALILSDTHFTANPRDAYRWGIFPKLEELIQQHHTQTVCFLGDLTDAKDNHSAELVNRIVNEIAHLSTMVDIKILLGNHDYLKRDFVFFEFLKKLPHIEFYTEIRLEKEGAAKCLWLPHTKTPKQDWDPILDWFNQADYIFMHQTVSGAIASNGQAMDGELDPTKFETIGKIYSGDIHVPQVIGNVEYVGSPYQVHFGDNFRPRVILITRDYKEKSIYLDFPKRVSLTVTSLEDFQKLKLSSGDHVKIKLELPPAEKHTWETQRKKLQEAATTAGLLMAGVELKVSKDGREGRAQPAKTAVVRGHSAVTTLSRFVEESGGGGEILDAGLDIMEGAVE